MNVVSCTARHFIEFLPAPTPPVLHPPPQATFLTQLQSEQKQALYIFLIPGKQLAISSWFNVAPYVSTPITLGNWTDLTCSAGGVIIQTTAGLFQPWMVGFSLVISAGTNFTAGTYLITAFNGQQSITVTSSPCPSAVGSGGTATLNVTLLPEMMIPKGASQKIDELNGQSSISTFAVNSLDADGTLKVLLADPTMIGQLTAFVIGFPGIDISQFATLHTNRIASVGREATGQIVFTLQNLLLQLVSDIFVNGGPDYWNVGLPENPQHTPPPSVRDNGVPISSANPRYFSGNPLNLILAVLQNELGLGQSTPPSMVVVTGGGSGTGQAGFGINPSWSFFDGISDITLINPNPYVDIPSIQALRDSEFSGDRMEFKLTGPQSGKSWLEDQLLKPLGLYFITRPTGELTLKTMKHPAVTASANATIITQDQIMGIPVTDRWPIINWIECTIPADTDATNTVTIPFAQQVSLSRTYSPYKHSVSSDGLRFAYGAFGKLFLLSNRIFNRHAFGTPEYTFTTYLEFILLNIGDFVMVTHPLILDLLTGQMGITSVLCEIVDREPDYTQGHITFKVADTRFMGISNGAFQIAPASASIPVWGSASTSQKSQYMFISNNTGLMSDGTKGNQVE